MKDKIDFICPFCKKGFSDYNDFYLKKINKNKSFITKVKCSCNKIFGLTYDIFGELVGFKL